MRSPKSSAVEMLEVVRHCKTTWHVQWLTEASMTMLTSLSCKTSMVDTGPAAEIDAAAYLLIRSAEFVDCLRAHSVKPYK